VISTRTGTEKYRFFLLKIIFERESLSEWSGSAGSGGGSRTEGMERKRNHGHSDGGSRTARKAKKILSAFDLKV